MNLIDVKIRPDAAEILYEIFRERASDVKVNISHDGSLPLYAQHEAFVRNHPYAAWYLIQEPAVSNDIAGSIYLTKPPRPSVAGNEIGIFIRKRYRGMGIGKKAVAILIAMHGPGRFLANINPANAASIGMFEGMGFQHCQNTYEFNAK